MPSQCFLSHTPEAHELWKVHIVERHSVCHAKAWLEVISFQETERPEIFPQTSAPDTMRPLIEPEKASEPMESVPVTDNLM